MLKHHNNGKEKSGSHRISESIFPEIPTGYGSTKKEAFEDFRNNTNDYINKLVEYGNLELTVDDTIEVDCLGVLI